MNKKYRIPVFFTLKTNIYFNFEKEITKEYRILMFRI